MSQGQMIVYKQKPFTSAFGHRVEGKVKLGMVEQIIHNAGQIFFKIMDESVLVSEDQVVAWERGIIKWL